MQKYNRICYSGQHTSANSREETVLANTHQRAWSGSDDWLPSAKGPRFDAQHYPGNTQPSVTPVQRLQRLLLASPGTACL